MDTHPYQKTCQTCEWWDATGQTAGHGLCRADPPRVQDEVSQSPWARIVAHDWCGSWLQAQGDEREER